MRKVIAFVAFIALFTIAQGKEEVNPQFKEIMPQADEFVVRSEKPKYYEARAKGKLLGYCFLTQDVAPEASIGFLGPIDILVATDPGGKILSVKIISHTETPEYVKDLDKPIFLDQFKSKTAADEFMVGKDIHGITGATISAKTVAQAIQIALLKIWPHPEPKEEEPKLPPKITPTPSGFGGQTMLKPGLRVARYWKALKDKVIQCLLCPRLCVISPGKRGICGVRQNIGGTLYTLVYGTPCAVHMDPIEKKPLFHMLPATQILSIATAGCNLRCIFCQNWQISQALPEETENVNLPPEDVIRLAFKNRSPSVAFTYTEPTIFFEYMIDTAKLAKERGIRTVIHTCGYVNEEPLRELCKYLDAANVDLKGFSDEFYQKIGHGKLKPVLDTIRIIKEEGVWLEITNLIIPNLNDDPQMIKEMCKWLVDNVGTDVPIHFSRFYPAHKLTNLPPTPVKTLETARKIAMDSGMKYVYIGNVPGHPGENTYCPKCKKPLIERTGYFIVKNDIVDGKCKFCGEKIPGSWK